MGIFRHMTACVTSPSTINLIDYSNSYPYPLDLGSPSLWTLSNNFLSPRGLQRYS